MCYKQYTFISLQMWAVLVAGLLQKVHTIPVSSLQIFSRFYRNFTLMDHEIWQERKIRYNPIHINYFTNCWIGHMWLAFPWLSHAKYLNNWPDAKIHCRSIVIIFIHEFIHVIVAPVGKVRMIPQLLKFLLWKTTNAQREIEFVAQELCGIRMQGDALVSCPPL